MSAHSLDTNDLVSLRDDIRSRKTSACATVGAYLARIESQNPTLNAFRETFADDARASASRVDQAIAAGDPVGPPA